MAAVVSTGPASYRWYEAWSKVYFHPSVQSFRDILTDPTASMGRANIWVAVMGLLGFAIQAVFDWPYERAAGIDPTLTTVCSVIGAPIAAVVGLTISAALFHLIARLFGGQGNFSDMAYSLAAVQAPASLVSAALVLIGALLRVIPAANTYSPNAPLALCVTTPISLAWGVFILILNVTAVRAVEKISTGKALATVFFPVVVVALLVGACLATGVLAAIIGSLQPQ